MKNKAGSRILMALFALLSVEVCLGGCAPREQKDDGAANNPSRSVGKESAADASNQSAGKEGMADASNETEGKDGTASQKRENPGYPMIQKQDLLTLEGADNPAGQMQDMCANIMVQVRAGNLLGSGVIVTADEEKLWIATAGHVLEAHEDGKSDVKIIFMDGYEVETAQVQHLDPQDVAIMTVPRMALVEQKQTENGVEQKQMEKKEEDHGAVYRRAILSQEAFDQAAVGDLVIAMGSRSGAGEDAYAGTILQDYIYLDDFGAYMMVAEVMVTPGMSGGGLFDAKGRLLGIICGVSEKEEVAVSSIMGILALELGGDD